MQIVESYSISKKGDEKSNEDAFIVTPSFLAVFDGSSLAAGEMFKYDGEEMSGGRFSSQVLVKAMENLSPSADYKEAVSYLTAEFNKAIIESGRDTATGLAATTAVIYSKYREEVWMVGDGYAVVDGVAYTNSLQPAILRGDLRQQLIASIVSEGLKSGRQMGDIEAELLQKDPTPNMISKGSIDATSLNKPLLNEAEKWALNVEIEKGKLAGKSEDQVRAEISMQDLLPKMLAEGVMKDSKVFRNSANKSFGYGVISGEMVPENKVKIIDVSKASEIILASDGFPEIKPTLRQTQEYLTWVIKEDPLCYKINPQPKAVVAGQERYDDATYVRVKIGSPSPK